MKPVINLSMAKVMADACEADQKNSGYSPINIAIVDAGGDLVLFRRQNDAPRFISDFFFRIDVRIRDK